MTDSASVVCGRGSMRVRCAAILVSVALAATCSLTLYYSALVVAHTAALHKVLHYAPSAVVVCDDTGSIMYTNDAVYDVTGYTEAELVRGGVMQLIPEGMQQAHRLGVENAVRKSQHGIEGLNYKRVLPVRKKDGGIVLCEVCVGTVRRGSKPQFFAFIVPITDAMFHDSPTLAPAVPDAVK